MTASRAIDDSERIEVTGVVQGVGFRPFVHRVARELGLRGRVGNDSARVFIEVIGPAEGLDSLVARIRAEAPPLAHVESITRHPAAMVPDVQGFHIVESRHADGPRTLVPPDTAVCDACAAELRDPHDRRHRHPFISCTNCGPRFTIIETLPYDRPNTTMASFEMCAACRAEYEDPSDRRYHAQPIGCHDCGPKLRFVSPDGHSVAGDDGLSQALDLLGAGKVIAIKGLGGFHLAVDAADGDAVQCLRDRKHRPDKPFAIMAADLDAARRCAAISAAEERLLTSPASPVVLLEALASSPVAEPVAPGNPLIGVMLPYTPVHHLLFDRGRGPLVMTSANHAGEPIIFRDDEIEPLLGTVADGLLTHDRPIVAPCDDSVVRVVGERLLPVRRSRGYAPLPVRLNRPARPVLAVGGELKNTFCVSDGTHAWVSPHIGDMGSLATMRTFEQTVGRFELMYDIAPEVVAIDHHPAYLTSRWALRNADARVEGVQHHHAHVAAVMAEYGLAPEVEVLGFAFDGTGYGTDGTVWGGEVLRADGGGFERVAHLAPVPLPGGDAAIEHPARVALAHLHAAEVEWSGDLEVVVAVAEQERQLLARQFESGFGCVPTTSMGRLFDAIAALLGIRHRISYEAQAAIELEHAARRNRDVAPEYRFTVTAEGLIDQRPIVRAIVDDLERGVGAAAIADGFHDAVALVVAELAARFARPGQPVVLSGGVFQNALLVERSLGRLREAGHDGLTHRLVPPNDGGLALGQAYVVAHRLNHQER